MPARTKIGGSGFGWEHIVYLILAGAAIKFAVDEISFIAERGFDDWRRRRFGS